MLETHVPMSTLGEYVSSHVLFNKSRQIGVRKILNKNYETKLFLKHTLSMPQRRNIIVFLDASL